MPFLTEVEPPRGVPIPVLPGIRRVVARNPSVMTYYGTNTYLVDWEQGLTIIDPGPADPTHVQDILRAAGGTPITRIIVTHAHSDHYGAVKSLKQASGAPVWGYIHSNAPQNFLADHHLRDGDSVAGLQALHTPGHAPDHLSFAYQIPEIGQILFSGDHVMAWSSSIVNPPEGNMRAYYQALELLLPRPDQIYLPGHGPISRDPKTLVRELLAHRQTREAAILEDLQSGPSSVGDIAARLYAKTDPNLKIAAQRNVLAHLQKLQEEGKAIPMDAETSAPGDMPEDYDDAPEPYLEMARKDAERRFKVAAF